jgi:hypothetical protein
MQVVQKQSGISLLQSICLYCKEAILVDTYSPAVRVVTVNMEILADCDVGINVTFLYHTCMERPAVNVALKM